MRVVALCSLLAVALRADRQQEKVNPVEKVVELLEKIQGEIEAEGQAEAASYDKYACFCKEQADNKIYAIEKFNETIEVLAATIEKKTADKGALNADIQAMNGEITDVEADEEAAAALREEENKEYLRRENMLAVAVQKMKDAIEAMEAMANAVGGGALIKKYSKVIRDSVEMADVMHIPTHHKKALLKFMQAASDGEEEPAGYSLHSAEVVTTLKGLLKTFKQKKIQADNEELHARQEYEMAAGARANQIKALNKAVTEKSEQVAALEEEINAAETEKLETENAKNADRQFLDDLAAKCEEKAKIYDQRSSTRTAELTAIAEALELLKGDVSKMYPANDLGLIRKKVAVKKTDLKQKASAIKPLPGHWEFVFDQAPKKEVAARRVEDADSDSDESDDADYDEDSDSDSDDDEDDDSVNFLQLNRPETAAKRKQVLNFLKKRARELKSTALTTMVVKLRDAPSPFAKVKQMIEDLITRLEDEAAAEASQKEWCDKEMSETIAARDEAQREIEAKNAFLMEKRTLVDSLAEDISVLSKEIADLQTAINKETSLREKDQANNNQTLAEAQAGLEAVENAIEVLSNFYTNFLQTGAKKTHKQAPAPGTEASGDYQRYRAAGAGADGATVDDMAPEDDLVTSDYGGKTDASKSILGLLDVIKSDFEKTLDDTQADEDKAQTAYEEFKTDAQKSIDDKSELKGTKEGEKTTAELDITQAEADLKAETTNLENELEELEKLKPVCVESGATHAERTARREQEIEALKEALKILQETDFGF
jgi:hypothetical protein